MSTHESPAQLTYEDDRFFVRRLSWLRRLDPRTPLVLWLTILGIWATLMPWPWIFLNLGSPPEPLLELMNALGRREAHAVVLAVVVAPVLEELIFRGVLLRALLVLHSRWTAIILSAALFATVHLNPYQLLPAFVMGILFGWIFERTRSVLLPIVGHALWNATPALLPGLFSVEAVERLSPLETVALAILGLAMATWGVRILHRWLPPSPSVAARAVTAPPAPPR